MSQDTRGLDITRITGSRASRERDVVVRESPLTIFLNDDPLVTLLCSPKDVEYLAAGFLFSEGIIKEKADIDRLFGDAREGAVWVQTRGKRRSQKDIISRRFITAGCGKGLSFVDSAKYSKKLKMTHGPKLSSGVIASLMKDFQQMSHTYRSTGGVHSAALADTGGIAVFNEDIGRHNAIDKVLGESLLKGIRTDAMILLTSGRISSDILVKAARARIPFVVSRSAPTDLSVKLSKDLGITIVGFARGSRMNVYSNSRRIALGP